MKATVKGIDISNWQSTLSLQYLETKPDFAIVRMGGADGRNGLYEDNSWRKFYMQCKILSIPVGGYWFATDTVSLQEQIAYCLHLLEDTQFEYPFFLDIEHDSLMRLSKGKLSDWVFKFLSTIESKHYYVGIYASASTWHYNFDCEKLERFDNWAAIWDGKTPDSEGMKVWAIHQKGVETWLPYGNLDTNVCNMPDYPEIMKTYNLNNF